MKETLTRLLSGIVYIILLIVAISFSYNTFLLLFGLFMTICVAEFCILARIPRRVPVLVAAAIYAFFAIYKLAEPALSIVNFTLLGIALGVMIMCFRFLFTQRPYIPTAARAVHLLGYIIIPFILICRIPVTGNGYEPKIIIAIFILIWTNDTFAYIVGKSIGRTKLFERISPKKTVEGFAGGMAFTVIASIAISLYYVETSMLIWILTAVIVSVFGTVGDLVESKFKRIAGAKDSGTIMPGHGGILDRMDSVIFVAPVIFLLYQIVYYVS
ncbi:MAG TPA: phosphatidate cytidylyltransferase [Flavobacterium sp.]|nr:phosphatidate cytidylyltransferase [Flavobacterium sp.]